jgi:Spy/CpxP family protein refolding chaperone
MFHYRQDFFPPPSEMPRRLTEDMRQDLALTEAQARAVRAAFENHQEELAVFHEEVQSRMTGIMDGLRDEIAAILTPEQAERWTARFDDMRERKMPFGPPPPWGGPGGPEGRERLGGR